MAKNHPKKTLAIPTRAPDQLGLAIKRFRSQARLTQAELAQNAGLRQATVSKAEKEANMTKLQTLYAICTALNLEVILRPRASNMEETSIEELFS